MGDKQRHLVVDVILVLFFFSRLPSLVVLTVTYQSKEVFLRDLRC